MQTLLVGLVMIAIGLVAFAVVFKGSRVATPSWLMSDGWVANVHVPLLIGLVTFGFGFVIQFVIAVIR